MQALADLSGSPTLSPTILISPLSLPRQGDTGERKLDNSKNNFERAAIDTFFLPAPNVGMMQRIKVG